MDMILVYVKPQLTVVPEDGKLYTIDAYGMSKVDHIYAAVDDLSGVMVINFESKVDDDQPE